jgi:hypothetical protein
MRVQAEKLQRDSLLDQLHSCNMANATLICTGSGNSGFAVVSSVGQKLEVDLYLFVNVYVCLVSG